MVKTAGMNLSHTNLAICLDLICKVRGIESAEQFFDTLPGPAKNERTFGSLLNCYCSEKLAEKANSLFEKMKDLDMASSTLALNNLMAMYQKLGQHEKVVSAFHNFKSSNVAPDNLSYCILMNSYASVGEIEAVEGVLKEMEDNDEVVVQWNAYSTLAAIYNYAAMHKKAESALKKLESLNDGSERELFHYLISLYAGAGNLEEVRRVWKLQKTTFTEQTNRSYLTMLHALNKFDDIEGMKRCFEEWESVVVAYDLKIPNLLIAAYLRNDMEGEAALVLEKAKAKNLSPDSRTCQLFMDYYLKNGKIHLAARYCEAASKLKEAGEWKLDGEKMDMFLKHFEEAGDVEGMEKLCMSLKKLGFLDSPSKAYESLIRTYVTAGKRSSSLRQRIFDANVELDPKMYKLLGKVCR
ncbi:Pentatricopeptide repeat-containing protein [Platanthera zijinensis]|uniref:Pentatricopeptide repeat-containing protein n=1 Tax=Platanthera zijinensis TaxID=2320716 RepID=A0AAP0ASM9_9ASPA